MHARDLEAYKVAYAAILEIHLLTKGFPKDEFYGGLVDQLRRASRSICANLIEGLSKKSTPGEEKRFLNISLGSVEEVVYWLQLSHDLGYMKIEPFEKLSADYDRIGRLIVGLIKRRTAA